MAMALDTQSADFERALCGAARRQARDRRPTSTIAVADIIADVRARGDAALAEYSLRFDRVDLGRLGLQVSAAEIEAAVAACDRTALEALKLAHARVMDFHRRQKPADVRFTDPLGVELGWRWRPIDAVGLYVPGGAASYPSSVLMNAVPAKVAGCRRIAMVVPTPDGRINPLVLAAARIAGRRRDLPGRRRPGDRRARLWHGHDRAGRQDRRPRQRLCRGRQAAGVRRRRHRHDRRAARSRRARRRKRRSALCRRRPSGAGRARRGGAIDPHHRRRAPGARRRRGSGAPAREPAAGQNRRGELARQRRDHPLPVARGRDSARRPARAGASRDHGARRRGARRQNRQRRRDLSRAPIRPKRSATMSAARTMSCRPPARPASRRGLASSTS